MHQIQRKRTRADVAAHLGAHRAHEHARVHTGPDHSGGEQREQQIATAVEPRRLRVDDSEADAEHHKQREAERVDELLACDAQFAPAHMHRAAEELPVRRVVRELVVLPAHVPVHQHGERGADEQFGGARVEPVVDARGVLPGRVQQQHLKRRRQCERTDDSGARDARTAQLEDQYEQQRPQHIELHDEAREPQVRQR